MPNRDDILLEYTQGDSVEGHVAYLDTDAMADEIARLREALREVMAQYEYETDVGSFYSVDEVDAVCRRALGPHA